MCKKRVQYFKTLVKVQYVKVNFSLDLPNIMKLSHKMIFRSELHLLVQESVLTERNSCKASV